MDIQRNKITIWLTCSILLLSSGLFSHVMALPVIFNVAGRDSWISVIIATPLFIGWFFLFLHCIKQLKQQSIFSWMNESWNMWISWGVRIIFAIILLFNGCYTLIDTSIWTNSTYLQETPFIVIVICLLLVSFLIAYSGLQSLAIVASVLLPLVIFLGYFVSISNTKYKDYSLLLPIFDHGITPPLQGAFYVFGALTDIWVIILIAHRMKRNMKLLEVLLFTIFLAMMVFGPIVGGITEFGPTEATKQQFTAFDQWRLLQLGQLLQHVDFFSIYQWLAGATIRLAINLYLLGELFNFKKKLGFVYSIMIISLFIFGSTFLKWREQAMLYILQHYYFIFYIVFIVIFTLAVSLTQWINNGKELHTNEP